MSLAIRRVAFLADRLKRIGIDLIHVRKYLYKPNRRLPGRTSPIAEADFKYGFFCGDLCR